MLILGGKKRKNAFFEENNVFNQIFNRVIVWLWTAWSTRLKNTQKVEIAEETEFLRLSKKSHFLKIDYRFWNLYEASSWDQKCVFLDVEHKTIPYRASSVHFCNRKFPPLSHISIWVQKFEI